MAKQRIAPQIDRKEGIWLIGMVSGLACIALWLHYHHPSEQPFIAPNQPNFLLMIFTGWELMLLAMMLPTTIPIVSLFSRMIQQRPHRTALQALLLLGYLTPWSLSGLAFITVYQGLGSFMNSLSTIHPLTWILGPFILISAGLFQFSSMKYACLRQCRSPLSFIMRYWRGRNDRREAYRLGMAHGWFCLGCCWLLMLTMTFISVHHLGWMLFLGMAMAIEKNFSKGYLIVKPLGMVLIIWGMILLVSDLASTQNEPYPFLE